MNSKHRQQHLKPSDQTKAFHAQRRAAALRKEVAKRKDGNGQQRAKHARWRSSEKALWSLMMEKS